MHLGVEARGGLEDIVHMVGGARGVVNLEGPLAAAGDAAMGTTAAGQGGARREGEEILLWNPVEAPVFLQQAGVVAASVANNHADDLGAEGLARTVAALAEARVLPFGGPAGRASLDLDGVTVALLAFRVDDPALASLDGSLDGLEVVAIHQVGPPSYLPDARLQAAVDAAVRAGAEVVVSHGSHAVARVERRGDSVIAWGLGNLLFDCPCTTATEALVLRLELEPGRVAAAEVLPVVAGLGGQPARASSDPQGVFDLLEALGSTTLQRRGDRAAF